MFGHIPGTDLEASVTKPWNRPRPKLKRYKKPDPACEESAEAKRERRRERNLELVASGGFRNA